jgi:hypothetical protein
MTSALRKTWQDPVWSKVIAAIILAIGAAVGTYFLHWWPVIGSLFSSTYNYALSSASIPYWLLAILCLLSLISIVIICLILWQAVLPTKSATVSWRSYTTDTYFNIRWRWKYFDDGSIYETNTFCPHCDFQVFPIDVSNYRFIDHIAFGCDSCGRHLGEFNESIDSLQSKTRRLIQQKIRNDTWRTQAGT